MTSRAEFAFTAIIEPVLWGTATYTIVRVPDEVAEAAKSYGTRRVSGTIDETPINLAITRAPVVAGAFLWAGKPLLRKAGLREGDLVEVRVHLADADDVDVPGDVTSALTEANVVGVWEGLTPADRRRKLYAVESKRTARSRGAAIAALVAMLRTD